MKIDHIAIWVEDLERMKDFYHDYFGTVHGEKYTNPVKGFSSYFLSFATAHTRLELMHRNDIGDMPGQRGWLKGLAHIAIAVGSRQAVNELTERLRADGHPIEGEPRTTGDGYYESVILDPEGNVVEITV